MPCYRICARASERLHGPRNREEYLTGRVLHCLSYFFERPPLYLSQSRSCPPKRSRAIYHGIWRRLFLRGLWARCTVCAFTALLLPFCHIHGSDRIHLRGHYEQGSSARHFLCFLCVPLVNLRVSQHLRVYIMRSRIIYEGVERGKSVSWSPPVSTRQSHGRRTMLVVSSIQFALATGHVITLLVQLIRAFIGAAGTLDGPSLYLLDQSTPEHVAQQVLYITNVRF